ncbi:MAG: nucleoside transporter C-terminal domain-containing protein [Rikenellaceae bacterium]
MVVSILRALVGILGLLAIAFLCSRNRKAINWTQVCKGLSIQLVLAAAILYIPFIGSVIEAMGAGFVKLLEFTRAGSEFLLGDLLNLEKIGYIFLFQVMPVTIFFASLTSILYYYGIVQKVVAVIAYGLRKILNISGAEGLVAAGNIFLGQTESPLLTKKYLPTMTKSEMFLVMTSGMATIAGGVMAAYIMMLGGDDPQATVLFAKHLITASVMAAPGAIVMAKIFFPETEDVDTTAKISNDSVGSNFFDALSNGTSEGVKLVVNMSAMLLVILALMATINYMLGGLLGEWIGLNGFIASSTNGQFTSLSVEYLLSLVFTPIAWLVGVTKDDMGLVASLLGKKLAINEFVAYADLNTLKEAGRFVSERSIILATYLLCGFANVSSVGILIGGIGSLAPNKKLFITQFGLWAVAAATLASCMSATIVGMFIH